MRAPRPLTFALFLAAAACGKKATEESNKPPPAPPVKVPLVVAKAGPTPQQIVLSGLIQADQRAEVTADTQGKVLTVLVERGKPVKANDVVVVLDTRNAALGAREAAANLANAKTQRELAEQECARTKQLFDKGAIPKAEYDRQMAQCTSALSMVSAAEARTQMMAKSVSDGVVRAPFDGIVAEKNVSPGEWVAPGRSLFTLVDADPLKIELSVPEVAVRAIKPGQRVDLITVADPTHTYGAKVTRIGAEVGRTRSLIVEAEVDKGTPLVPGMFAEARITIGNIDRPIVPKTSVKGKCGDEPRLEEKTPAPGPNDASKIQREEKCRGPWHAFVVVKGELEERVVQLGPEVDGKYSILGGIKNGEKVVETVTDKIVDGLKVVE